MGKIQRRVITQAKPVETHVSTIDEKVDEKVETVDEKSEKVDEKDNKIRLIKSKSVKKTKYLGIRMSEEEYDIISKYAKKENINISDIIRIALIEKGIL